MKTLIAVLIFVSMIIFLSPVQAEETASGKTLHDIHAMMRLMNNSLCEALEGSNLQMFGQMGMSERLDKDMVARGTKMVENGRKTILNLLEGNKMKALHKDVGFDEKAMRDLHALGDRMLHVIEEVENLHREAMKHK